MKNFMIIEDNFELSAQWSRALRERGANVFAAVNIDEALLMLEARAFDLFVVDIFLSEEPDPNEIGGITFIHRIRSGAYPTTRSAPIIAVSGSRLATLKRPSAGDGERIEFSERVLRAGADRFLIKPITTDDLLAAIDELSE